MNLPSGWNVLRLGDTDIEIIDGDRGKHYPKKSELLSDGYCLFINSKNLIGDRISLDEVEYISQEKDSMLRSGKVFVNDILITTRGSTLGYVGLFHEQLNHKFARINSGMVILRNQGKLFDLEFLYALLKSPVVKAQFTSLTTGSAQPQLPIRDLKKVELVQPPLEIQRRIADILGALEEKIQLNRQMNETLEQMAMALYKHWFVDFGPFQNGEFVESELGMIPKGWTAGTLGNIATTKNESVRPNEIESDTPYIGLEHMPRGSIALDEWGDSQEVASSKFRFAKGDILFGKLRPYFKKVGVAAVDGICSTDIYVLQPKQSSWFGMVLCQVIQQNFIDYCSNGASGTKMPRTNWLEMSKYQMVIPPDRIAEGFNIVIQTCVQQVIANVMENLTLKSIRDYLLTRLLSGEIELRKAEEQVEEVLTHG